jgi:hypothetical protein
MRTIACGFALVAVATVHAADGASADPQRLVAALASADFRERETAARRLERLGDEALEPLRRAAAQGDAETRRRAAELVERICRRRAADRLLAPAFLDLDYRRTPLAAAVADLSRRAQMPISLHGDPVALGRRTVTLTAQKVTPWQALRLFCSQTGLHESDYRSPSSPPVPLAGEEGRGVREGTLVLGQTLVRRGQLSAITVPVPATQVELMDGSGPELAAHLAGSVRVRAAPVGVQQAGAGTYSLFVLISAEPRLALEGPTDLRVERAVDESGRLLGAHAIWPPPNEDHDDWPRGGRVPAIVTNRRRGPVSIGLDVGATSAPKRLRELAGVVTLSTFPAETVVTLLKPGDSKGEVVQTGNMAFTPKSFTRHSDGDVRTTVEVRLPYGTRLDSPVGGLIGMPGRGRGAWAGQELYVEEARVAGDHQYQGLCILDASGRLFEAVSGDTVITGLFPQWYTVRITALFRPPANGEAAAKLTFAVRRPVTIDVPFVLRDVPLP